MKGPLYRSDDGQKEGTREEVEAYEANLNPLAKFKFPWRVNQVDGRCINANGDLAWGVTSGADVVPLLNLMPLVEELRQKFVQNWGRDWRESRLGSQDKATRELLLAYEKALGVKS